MLHIISIECSASESNAKRCPVWGSNSRPSDYETDALPTALTRLRRVTDLYLVVWPLNILVVKYDDNKEKSVLICLAPVAQSVSASYLYVSIDKEMRRSGVRASPGASCFLSSKNTYSSFNSSQSTSICADTYITLTPETQAGYIRIGELGQRVASVGVEPTTFALLARRSNRLS